MKASLRLSGGTTQGLGANDKGPFKNYVILLWGGGEVYPPIGKRPIYFRFFLMKASLNMKLKQKQTQIQTFVVKSLCIPPQTLLK